MQVYFLYLYSNAVGLSPFCGVILICYGRSELVAYAFITQRQIEELNNKIKVFLIDTAVIGVVK